MTGRVRKMPFEFAVLGQVSYPVVNSFLGRAAKNFAVNGNFPGGNRERSEQRQPQFLLAGPGQARNPKHFPGMKVERYIAERLARA